ncbi:hypothetical protein MRS44_017507 [Fusarium solani]|uniref:uncharacterized protein n=1 Tax=Fusarium solani TaxID=169388 RepID=UPI0032C41EE5|nr:hypothetical protein MRS44_017507 [Fusarium solani]
MPPIKADAAFVWRQFIDLGRSNYNGGRNSAYLSQDESRSFAYDAAAAVIAGGRPFSLFESRRWRYFFTRIKPGWKPPSRAVITRILPEFYQEIYDEVFKRITSSEWFNILF